MNANEVIAKLLIVNPDKQFRTNEGGTRVEACIGGEWFVFVMLGIDGKWYRA